MDQLKVTLQVLKEHQLFAMYSKCEFWLRSVVFLVILSQVRVYMWI